MDGFEGAIQAHERKKLDADTNNMSMMANVAAHCILFGMSHQLQTIHSAICP